MEKTLGGDRLGSGKRMKVELHGYERSTHNMGYLWRSTMAAGTLVPFIDELALPGDTFDIDLESEIMTHPTIGPLFGSFKAQYDVFVTPIRLYNGMLHNNALNIGRYMNVVKIPQIILTPTTIPADVKDIDNAQINPSSLLAYFGIRGVGWTDGSGGPEPRSFNALKILAYWDIYKNYYSNKQEQFGAVLHTPSVAPIMTVTALKVNGVTISQAPAFGGTTTNGNNIIRIEFTGAQPLPEQIFVLTGYSGGSETRSIKDLAVNGTFSLVSAGVLEGQYNFSTYGPRTIAQWNYRTTTEASFGKPDISIFNLDLIDEMRTKILQATGTTVFTINSANLEPYKWLYEQPTGIPNVLSSQEGLGLKTYQSDLFNNWLNTEWIDGVGGINEITAIDTSGGSFTIDTLNLSRKVWNMLNRIAVSGGTYQDWLDAVYTHERYTECESPMYMGGLIKELIFQEVVSNSESTTGQPLGTLAGKGAMSKKHKGGKVVIKVDEPSYIIGIVSLTPRIDYSQGNKWDNHLLTMDDLHKPALDEIGFQELIVEQMAWWTTYFDSGSETWTTQSVGKQPAWINYMTNVNKVYGNFAVATNEMFMTLNRRYEYIVDIGTGIPRIVDLSTYIDPSHYNFIFAETNLDAQNFWVQIAVDMTVRRKMSAKVMPNL